MKTRLKVLSPSQRQLTVEVARERVQTSYDEVYRDLGKRATIPGFRPGKAPREVLEQHHRSAARDEVIRRLVAASLEEAMQQAEVQAAGRITVANVELNETAGLTYRATIEVAPAFKLGRYKGLPLKRPAVTVNDEEVQQLLQRLQAAHAERVPVEGSADKEQRLPALDDEFAKDLGLATLAELTGRLRQDLTAQKDAQVRRQLEEAACALLLERMAFEVPASLIERRTEQLKRDFVVRLLLQGVAEEELPAKVQAAETQLGANAAKLVQLSFILQRIAEAEHIEVTTEDVTAHLRQLAARWQCTVEQAKAHLEQEHLWDALLQELRQEQTIRWVVAHANME